MASNQVDTSTPLSDMRAYQAPSLSQPSLTRQAIRDIRDGKRPPMLGYFAGLGSPQIAQWVAPMGFDACFIDWAHANCNVETMTAMVHSTIFMSGGRTIPFVRIPGHDHASIGYALDSGASLIIPQVETVEEAQKVVSSAKFGAAHKGTRSAPPFRQVLGVNDTPYDPTRTLHECLNDQAAICLQIETLKGVQNLDAILTEVKDIDLVFLAPLDTRINMGLQGFADHSKPEEEEWIAVKKLFAETVKKHDVGRAAPLLGPLHTFGEAVKDVHVAFFASDTIALLGMAQQLGEARAILAAKKDVTPVGEEHGTVTKDVSLAPEKVES